MEILQVLFIIAAAILTVLNLFILYGLRRGKSIGSNWKKEIFFSIIVAAKNEEDNVSKLLSSLRKIDYPEAMYEIIIVDDNSSDNTFAAVLNYKNEFTNFSVHSLKEKSMPGKKGALDYGISKAQNPFILITDADCRPQRNWLKSYAERFIEGYDFLFGIAPFDVEENLINKISCFENLRSSILTFSSANLGIPFSAAARNFGFKKSSFEKIKGYGNTIETLSGDDDLLLREAVKNKMKIGTISGINSFVYSSAKSSFKKYFSQRSRHTKTSFYYLPSRQIILGLWHAVNLICLFSFLLIRLDILFVLPFIIKLLFDIISVRINQNNFGYHFKIRETIVFQIFYEIFLIINFTGAIFKKDKWK